MALVAVVLPILAAVPPFSSFGPQNVFVFTFADAGVFVLLALGLNVVVGLAGLLDLGYVAFFVIGAYTMAYDPLVIRRLRRLRERRRRARFEGRRAGGGR